MLGSVLLRQLRGGVILSSAEEVQDEGKALRISLALAIVIHYSSGARERRIG